MNAEEAAFLAKDDLVWVITTDEEWESTRVVRVFREEHWADRWIEGMAAYGAAVVAQIRGMGPAEQARILKATIRDLDPQWDWDETSGPAVYYKTQVPAFLTRRAPEDAQPSGPGVFALADAGGLVRGIDAAEVAKVEAAWGGKGDCPTGPDCRSLPDDYLEREDG